MPPPPAADPVLSAGTAPAGARPALGPIACRLVQHAWPMLIGQVASIGMAVSDTIQLGHYSRDDLAAVAVGSALYVSTMVSLQGVVSAIAPSVAQLRGAGGGQEIGRMFQQGVWLAFFLSLLGCAVLALSPWLLAGSVMTPEVRAKAETYLRLLGLALPGMLLYRAVFAFNQALGRPRPMMVMNLVAMTVHVALSWALIHGAGPWAPMGSAGCGVSSVVVSLVALGLALLYLKVHEDYRPFELFQPWHAPRWPALRELLRVGLPMGLSNLVEVTSFALIAVFLGALGAEVVAGHRVVANLHTLLFMIALSLGTSTLVHVGQAAGARDEARARWTALVGLALAGAVAATMSLAILLGRGWVVSAYTGDARVAEVALALIPLSAAFLVFDALHTVASFSLRGLKVTLHPMLIHVSCFWGVGLGGGYLLAFAGIPGWVAPMGARGFWLMSALATALALLAVGTVLARVLLARQRPG